MAFMGVDIGTTGTKAAVMNRERRIVSSARREYPLSHPRPGWAELDPREVWDSVKAVIARAAAEAGEPVEAVAFSALGEAVTPVDGQGRPLDNTAIAMDNRAEAESRDIASAVGARRLYEITGQPPHPMYSLNKILWWKRNRPDVDAKAWKYLCWQDYATFLLCGEPAIDYSLASRTGAFDIRELEWSEGILDAAGVDAGQLPVPGQSGTPAGRVRDELARELGLQPGAVVAHGGFDQPSAALGAGILEPGTAVDGMGTVECVTPALDRAVTDDGLLAGNIPCCPHVVPGLYIFMGFNFSGGCLLQWHRDQFALEERLEAERTGRDAYEIIVERAMERETGAMVLPHFLGAGTPHLDPAARGALVGLTLGTDRRQVARAILEGIAFEMKLNLEILDKAGVKIDALRATGGGAKSPAWLQLRADAWNKPITVMETAEGGCLAMAAQAAVAGGAFGKAREALDGALRFGDTFKPDPARAARYGKRYECHRRIYPALREIHHQLTRFEAEGA